MGDSPPSNGEIASGLVKSFGSAAANAEMKSLSMGGHSKLAGRSLVDAFKETLSENFSQRTAILKRRNTPAGFT